MLKAVDTSETLIIIELLEDGLNLQHSPQFGVSLATLYTSSLYFTINFISPILPYFCPSFNT